MAIKFRCPKCGKQIKVGALVGATVACSHCKNDVVVPMQGTTLSSAGGEKPAGQPPPQSTPPEAKGEEAEEEFEEPSTLMSYLALYLPSWGTSVIFHAALVLLCVYTVWGITPETLEVNVTASAVESKVPPKATPRHKAQKKGHVKRVRPKPGVPLSKIKIPSRPAGPLGPISVIGKGVGRSGLDGVGPGGEGMGGDYGGLFDSAGGANKIVYLIDRSASMIDTLDYVKLEMRRSIETLNDKNSMHIIFFSSGDPLEMPTKRLVPATQRNKRMAFEFIESVDVAGQTDPADAIKRAFVLRPELIHLLTDGEFDREIAGLVGRLNGAKKIVVNTISFIYRGGEKVLKQIAKENGGTYKFISEDELFEITEP